MEQEVLKDLKTFEGNKSKLMQHYSDEMTAIVKIHGGNVSDVPMNKDSRYHVLQQKLHILNRIQV